MKNLDLGKLLSVISIDINKSVKNGLTFTACVISADTDKYNIKECIDKQVETSKSIIKFKKAEGNLLKYTFQRTDPFEELFGTLADISPLFMLGESKQVRELVYNLDDFVIFTKEYTSYWNF